MINFSGDYIINKKDNEYKFKIKSISSSKINILIDENCYLKFIIKYNGCSFITFKLNKIEYKLLNNKKYKFMLNKNDDYVIKPYNLTNNLLIKLIILENTKVVIDTINTEIHKVVDYNQITTELPHTELPLKYDLTPIIHNNLIDNNLIDNNLINDFLIIVNNEIVQDIIIETKLENSIDDNEKINNTTNTLIDDSREECQLLSTSLLESERISKDINVISEEFVQESLEDHKKNDDTKISGNEILENIIVNIGIQRVFDAQATQRVANHSNDQATERVANHSNDQATERVADLSFAQALLKPGEDVGNIKKNNINNILDIKEMNIENNNHNYISYKVNDDLQLYLKFSNVKTSSKNILKLIDYKGHTLSNNNFNVDHYFYKYINNIEPNDIISILKNITNYGFENGLIYHPKQIMNLFRDIKILEDKSKNIIVEYNNNYENIKNFVNREIYEKNYNWYLENFIKTYENNINNDELLLIVFIGNNTVGTVLLDKIINYKKIQPTFILAIAFRNNELYELYKNKIIDNFNNYILYITNEFGADIIPSLLVYNDIKKKINFNKIIKLQTKNDIKWFNELTDYLLTKNLEELNKKYSISFPICNCLGHPNKTITTISKMEMINNSKLNTKYKYLTNKNYFIAGTIFFCDKIVFEKILNFIENNNYRAFFTNNLYDTNLINITNSLIHYLERLFGIIKLN